MKKILAIALTLILTFTMTTVAFAETKPGEATLSLKEKTDIEILEEEDVPVELKDFYNPDFIFGEQTIVYTAADYTAEKRTGIVIESPDAAWTLSARMTSFYKTGGTTRYLQGFALKLTSAQSSKAPSTAAFVSGYPNSGSSLAGPTGTNPAYGSYGTAVNLAKGNKAGVYGVSWLGVLNVPSSATKTTNEDYSAVVEWSLVNG